MTFAKISGIAYYLPEQKLTNADLARENPKWNFAAIEEKTGIRTRYIAAADEKASDLAVRASEKLLLSRNIKRDAVDAVIYCTQSPDFKLPATACILQKRLDLSEKTAAFDINQGCSGYIYGLAVASSMIAGGIAHRVLFVCSETYSKYIAPEDRTARTVFGDGAAATLLEGGNTAAIGPFVLFSDGGGMDKIIVRDKTLELDGAGVFIFTMDKVPECVNQLLDKAQMKIAEIDHFIFHQASKVVLDNIVRILKIDEEKVFRGYQDIGNTVSASIPIALAQAEAAGKIKSGDTVMLVGFGVGLSWGGCILKW